MAMFCWIPFSTTWSKRHAETLVKSQLVDEWQGVAKNGKAGGLA
jgi:hypothetical protein